MKRFTCIWVAVLLMLLSSIPGFSHTTGLPFPQGEVILTIQGNITKTNDGQSAKFDMAMLEGLPRHVVKTKNPWEHGVKTYEGVLLRDLLAAVGANGAVMTVFALDDYHDDISAADAQSIDVILAYKRDGQYMPIRKRGPLFVVFPFTDDPSLLTEKRQNQSVWQVDRIEIE